MWKCNTKYCSFVYSGSNTQSYIYTYIHTMDLGSYNPWFKKIFFGTAYCLCWHTVTPVYLIWCRDTALLFEIQIKQITSMKWWWTLPNSISAMCSQVKTHLLNQSPLKQNGWRKTHWHFVRLSFDESHTLILWLSSLFPLSGHCFSVEAGGNGQRMKALQLW